MTLELQRSSWETRKKRYSLFLFALTMTDVKVALEQTIVQARWDFWFTLTAPPTLTSRSLRTCHSLNRCVTPPLHSAEGGVHGGRELLGFSGHICLLWSFVTFFTPTCDINTNCSPCEEYGSCSSPCWIQVLLRARYLPSDRTWWFCASLCFLATSTHQSRYPWRKRKDLLPVVVLVRQVHTKTRWIVFTPMLPSGRIQDLTQWKLNNNNRDASFRNEVHWSWSNQRNFLKS